MSEKYKVRNDQALSFITLTIIDWIDLFTKERYSEIIIDSLKYCIKNKGLRLHAFVIMSSHIHLIISMKEKFKVSDFVRDFKKFTSREITILIESEFESRKEWLLSKFSFAANRVSNNEKYKVWQDGYHPVELFNNKVIDQKLEYLHLNPVKAGIVLRPEDFNYSSARNYIEGAIDIVMEVELIS